MSEAEQLNTFQMYLNEVEKIPCCDEAENQSLVPSGALGDTTAKRRLVEGNLKLALGMIGEYFDRGVPVGDLVQEANIALVMAVEELAVAELKGEPGEFEEFLKGWVRTALQEVVKRQNEEEEVQREMLNLINALEDTSKTLVEELGREATVEELAERMKLPVDDVKDIMKMALDAMNVSGE